MDAYILDWVRTPRGRGREDGSLAKTKPVELLRQLYAALEDRTHAAAHVESVILGCVTEVGDQGANIAKVSALYAGWPNKVAGSTINNFCASGLSACETATLKLAVGSEQLVVAGGVESMSRVPMFADKGAYFTDKDVMKKSKFVAIGIAADLVATLDNIERKDADAFAIESHRRAAAAHAQGKLRGSMVDVQDETGAMVLDRDENVRGNATVEKIAAMPPFFVEMGAAGVDAMILKHFPQLNEVRHIHTVANAPAMADGAALVLMGTAAKANELGLKKRARIRAVANHADDPLVMLTAGGVASEKALKKAGLTMADIDLFEVNEAFAAVPIKYMRDYRIDADRFNVNGGAIATGHAMGATGAILVGTCLDELEARGKQFGLISIVGAAGLGMAMVIERVA